MLMAQHLREPLPNPTRYLRRTVVPDGPETRTATLRFIFQVGDLSRPAS